MSTRTRSLAPCFIKGSIVICRRLLPPSLFFVAPIRSPFSIDCLKERIRLSPWFASQSQSYSLHFLRLSNMTIDLVWSMEGTGTPAGSSVWCLPMSLFKSRTCEILSVASSCAYLPSLRSCKSTMMTSLNVKIQSIKSNDPLNHICKLINSSWSHSH